MGSRSLSHPLTEFYNMVKARSPTLAVLISEDVVLVALGASYKEHEAVQEAVDRLREMTTYQEEALIEKREAALKELGYSV